MPTIQSLLGDGVNLPPDFLPDDTKVLYDRSGCPVREIDYDDPDDELLADSRSYDRCAKLALAYYNDKHCTDYEVVRGLGGGWCFHSIQTFSSTRIHCGFTATPSTAVERESSIVRFFAVLEQAEQSEDVIVSSCCVVDDLKTTGCESCDIFMCGPLDLRQHDMEVEHSEYREYDPPLSTYACLLASGVSLSEKAQFRLPYALQALVYYNRRLHKYYKLVDVLPFCFSMGSKMVIHCNFIARQHAPADDDRLFFAELAEGKDDWVVTACHILHGCKISAGCYICERRKGKRVLHPARGFRFGLDPPVHRCLRRRC